MTMKLQAKGNSGKGELFQRVIFRRVETSEIKDFFPQEDTGKCGCLGQSVDR